MQDNHVWSTGSITHAVNRARSVGGFSLKIEVECRTQQEAEEAIAAGADVIMLDNFTPENLWSTAAKLKQSFPHVVIETSGGITVETVDKYCSPHVDVSLNAANFGPLHHDD
jgi:nicotinate-nucleotide pyrophosphorylase (carboxylating)